LTVRQPIGRIAIVAVATLLATLSLLFPPWSARAVRTTTRYAAVAGVAPATVVDTITWSLSFASLLDPPRVPLSGDDMQALAHRSMSGDANARAALRRVMDPFERRYHVPEVLRTSGEIWRDSVLATAGIPAFSSYDAAFALDEGWIAARLIAITAIALLLERRRFRRGRGAS
jgi:hypothetical protein